MVVTVLKTTNDSEGWQIAVKFRNLDFLLDTHFHGTSTMFCTEKSVSDKTAMLAFLGCFLPELRLPFRLGDHRIYPTEQTCLTTKRSMIETMDSMS